MKSEEYLRQAEVCEAEARKQTATALRRQFEFLARQWREFAARIALVEKSKNRIVQSQIVPSQVVSTSHSQD